MFKKEALANYLAKSAVFTGIYFLIAKIGLSFAEQTSQATVVWPATGLAIAMLLIFGVRYWPAVFFSALFVNLTLNEPVLAAFGVAIGNALEAVVAALLLRHWHFSESLRRIGDVGKFIFAAVLFGPAISASIGAISLSSAGLATFQDFLSVWLVWFVGDAMGALVVTPLILTIKERGYRAILSAKKTEATMILTLTAVVTAIIFSSQMTNSPVLLQLKFAIFPLLIWSAVALSQLGVAVSVLLVSIISIANTTLGSGPFTDSSSFESNLILLQVFMFFGAVSAMVLSAAVSEASDAHDRTAESERRYRQLVELSPDAIFIQSGGRFIFLNSAAVKLYGASHPDELVGRSVLDFVHHDYARMAGHRIKQFTEQKINRLDGATVVVEAAAVPFIYSGKPAAQVIMRDIRARKEAEHKLNISMESVERERARDEALLESIAEGVVAIDNAGRVIYLNNQAETLLGYKEEELLGRVFNEVVPAEDEKGTLIPSDKRPFHLAVTTRKRTTSAADYIIIKDRTKIPVLATASPVMLEGRVVGAIGTYRDISKEKEIEKAKSEFISLASHQLRSPLTAFKWVIELLRKDKKANKNVREKVEYLYRSNERLITLVNDLLSVSRIDVGTALVHKQPADIKKLINDTVYLLKPDAEAKKQKIKLSLKIELVNSVIDPSLFTEAFKNILDNAIAYGPAGTDIAIGIDQMGMEYVVSIHNDGPPIADQDKAKLFTRFYRGAGATTQKPTGSGLGLFISRSSIEANGGRIWFETGEKKGTTFFFTVPITS